MMERFEVSPTLKRLDAMVSWFATVFGWSIVVMIAITIFDVVSRRFFVVGSVMLQEAEWHLHAMLFFSAIGYAYLRGAHVRIDLISHRFKARRRLWIELFGILIMALPFALILLWGSIEYWADAWHMDEGSSTRAGIPNRWAIKAIFPAGLVLFILALFVRAATCWTGLARQQEEAALKLLTPETSHNAPPHGGLT